MTWFAQVRHVLAKDIREFRWLLAGYVAIVAVSSLRAGSWSAPLPLGLMMFVVVLSGMLVVASAVQTDSPSSSDAFWATHPLRPSAVMGAKVGLAAMLLMIGMVGQAVALGMFHIPAPEVLRIAMQSIAPYGVWLLVAMIAASLARDLPWFVLSIIMMVTAGFIVLALLAPDPSELRNGAPQNFPRSVISALALVATVGGCSFVAWLYRSRDGRLPVRLAGLAVAAVALFATMGRGSDSRGVDAPLPPTEPIPLSFDPEPQGVHIDGGGLRLRLKSAPLEETLHLRLSPRSYVLHLRDGSVMRLEPDRSVIVDGLGFSGSQTPDIPGVQWISAPYNAVHRINVHVPLTAEQRVAIGKAGIASVELEGRVVVSEVEPFARLPLVVGSRIVTRGYRLRVNAWNPELGEEMEITLGSMTVDRTPAQPGSMMGSIDSPLECALVNTSRGEALMLAQSGQGSMMDGLVLPGAPLRAIHTDYGLQRTYPPSNRTIPDAAWLRDAELLVVTRVLRGSYPVHLELKVH